MAVGACGRTASVVCAVFHPIAGRNPGPPVADSGADVGAVSVASPMPQPTTRPTTVSPTAPAARVLRLGHTYRSTVTARVWVRYAAARRAGSAGGAECTAAPPGR